MTFKLDNWFARLLEVKNPENLEIDGCGEGSAIVAKVDTLDDVFVLQGEFLLTRRHHKFLPRSLMPL